MNLPRPQTLPSAAPARVLALGAWLKNTACLLDGAHVFWSVAHGDLGRPEACAALEASAQTLLAQAGGRIDAVAHDLHPDFPSTHLALELAQRLGVPAVAVQHHHAHIAVAQAEQGSTVPVIGLALDGVGLGTDGTAWGGEVLAVAGAQWQRLGHLPPLALPGGDVAAREPWRMAAALLHALGRGDEIEARLAPAVGGRLANGVRQMLDRQLHCPLTTSAGRWFDAMAGLLGLSVRQAAEAEAAVSLERRAAAWLAVRDGPLAMEAAPTLNTPHLQLLDLATQVLELADAGEVDRAAAVFHLGLADWLAQAARAAALQTDMHAGAQTVVLAGGCFYNRVLTQALTQALTQRQGAAALKVQTVRGPGPGDGGLALGQAWIAAHQVAAASSTVEQRELVCA